MKHRVYPNIFKPLIDRLCAAVLLVLLSPLMAALAAIVCLTSPGPALFRQKRVGVRKTHFQLYKFRSMRSDTPGDVPTHLLADPQAHITKIGRFLRRSSLDELPQLLNILRGEMSFIGPRPALWNQYDLVDERDRWDANDVMPGLTGWAQVNGRDELPIPVKAERDGYYARNISFALDLRILFLTVVHVLRAKGVVEGRNGQ